MRNLQFSHNFIFFTILLTNHISADINLPSSVLHTAHNSLPYATDKLTVAVLPLDYHSLANNRFMGPLTAFKILHSKLF